MENFKIMECLESSHHLDEVPPHITFFKEGGPLSVINYLLIDISSIGVLHDDTKRLTRFFKKGLLVCYNIGVSKEKSDSEKARFNT